eukprot:4645731-Amphidinium_carterae.2
MWFGNLGDLRMRWRGNNNYSGANSWARVWIGLAFPPHGLHLMAQANQANATKNLSMSKVLFL